MVRNLLMHAVFFAAILSAGGAQAMDSIALRKSVEHFMAGYADKLLSRLGRNGRVEYTVAALDTRVTLPDCPAPLVFEPRDQGQLSTRINLQVSCTRGNVWSVYVPVDLNIYQPVIIAVRPLMRGQDITAADLQLSEANTSRLTGQFLTDLSSAIGMSVKRPIAQGSAVFMEQLEAPLMIRRGEVVTISAESGVVAVKMQGVALTDGRRGERIRIKNKGSSKIVEGQVVGPGLATVRM